MKKQFAKWTFYFISFGLAVWIIVIAIQGGSYLWQPTQPTKFTDAKTAVLVEMTAPTHIGDTVKLSIHSIDYYVPDSDKGLYEKICITDVILILPSGYQTFFANADELCGFITQTDSSRPTRISLREPWTVNINYGSLGKSPINLATGLFGEKHEFAFSFLVHYQLIQKDHETREKAQIQKLYPFVHFLSFPNSIGWEIALQEINLEMGCAPGIIVQIAPSHFLQMVILINVYILFGFVYLMSYLDGIGEFMQVATGFFFSIFGISQLFTDYSAHHSSFELLILLIYIAFGIAFFAFIWKKIHKATELAQTPNSTESEQPESAEKEIVTHIHVHQEENSVSIMIAGILAGIFTKFFGKK